MEEPTELQILVELLGTERPETSITFREESARDIRYTLVLGCDDSVLLMKLAWLFGCLVDDLWLLKNGSFEASDNWHGRGQVDLRRLADEFIPINGEFFDFDVTVAELRVLAGGDQQTLHTHSR